MFFEDQFPTCISFGARGGPMFSTAITRTASGRRSANRNFEYPLHDYEASYGVKKQSDFEEVRAFFYNVFGQFDGFRYKDWADFTATSGQGVIVTVDGAAHLAKRYAFGSRTFDRLISKPVNGTVTITGGGTLDYTTGVITGGSPTAWTGEFDVPCAFMTDLLTAEIINKQGSDEGEFILSWASIPIREIRL